MKTLEIIYACSLQQFLLVEAPLILSSSSQHISKFKMGYKITLKLRPNAPSCIASYLLSPKDCKMTLDGATIGLLYNTF